MPTYQQPKTGLGSVEETNRLLQGASAQTGIAAPTFSPTGAITSDVLSGNESSIQLPPAPTSTYTSPVIVPPPNGTAIDSKTGVATYTPPTPTTPAPQTKSLYQSTLEKLGIAGEQLAEKPEFTARVQEEAQLAQKREKQAQSYNAYQQAQLDLTRQVESLQGQGLTDVQRNAQEREIRRKGNANVANLAIVAQADQNLLAAAEQTIKDKVDAQFSPIQDQIDWLTKFASIAQNDLTESEKTILTAQINKQQTDYDNLTSVANSLQQNMLANGAPQSTYSALDKIVEDYHAGRMDAQTAQSRMYASAGTYGTDILGRKIKEASLAKTYQDIAKAKAEADALAGGGKSEDLLAYASQYSDTGKLPSPAELKLSGLSVGQVTAMAKQTPKPSGALVSTNTGTKSSALSPTQEAGVTALSEIVQQTLPNMQRLFPKIATGVLGGLGGIVWTSQNKQDYLTFRAEFLSKLLVARSGAAVTEQEYARYSKLLPTAFNQPFFLGSDGSKKLTALQSSMVNNLNTVLNTQQLSIYGYSKIKVNGIDRTVGEVLDIGGVQYRVLPDGTLTDII